MNTYQHSIRTRCTSAARLRPIPERNWLALLGVLGFVCFGVRASVVLNFEDLPAPGPGTGGLIVGNQPEFATNGITFTVSGSPANSPAAFDFSQAIPGFAHSGTKALEICNGVEFCEKKLEMVFTRLQTHVKVWVGYDLNTLSSAQTVIMRAYAGSTPVASGTATLGPSSNYYIPIQAPLEVNVGSASITRVTVGFLGAESGAIFNNGLCFDDVEFDQGPPPPCPATHNPGLTVTKPVSGTVVQANSFIADYTATSPDPFAQVTMTVTGPNAATHSTIYYFTGHFGPIQEDGGLFPGLNQVAITVTDCFGSTTTTRTVEYDPIDASTRFQVMGIEITQTIQDLHNSVPMIAGKRTFARVYVRSEGPATEIRNVTGWLRACRPDGGGLICLSDLGSSVQSLNTITVDTSSDVTAKRRDLNASLNFELPPDWIAAGNLHVEVTLRAPGADSLPCDGCNNPDRWGGKAFVQFQTAPPLFLQVVNLNYMRTMGGICCTLFSPNQSDADNLTSLLRRLYPTSVISSGPVIQYQGYLHGLPVEDEAWDVFVEAFGGEDDLWDDMNDRLSSIRGSSLRSSHGDHRTRFYGMIKRSPNYPPGQWDGMTPDIPATVCCGSTDPFTGAHELGHCYGQGHVAGCDDPSDPDEHYPFPNGQIGHANDWYFGSDYFGFDAGDGALGIKRRVFDPATTYDFMSYWNVCGGTQWISPYKYGGILAQMRSEQGAQSQQSVGDNILLTGQINLTRGMVDLGPFWRLPDLELSPPPSSSDFSIVLFDAQGGMLGSNLFQPKLHTERHPTNDVTFLLSEVVPFVQGTSRIAIHQAGLELASRDLSASTPVVTNVTVGIDTNGNNAVFWQANDNDSTNLWYAVQYSPNGINWQTLDIGLQELRLDFDGNQLPGGTGGQFRVWATDGVNTGVGYSPQSSFATNKPPRARIFAPDPGSAFASSQTVVFAGEGTDLEDGLLDGGALQWRSDLQGVLGSGHMISATGLMLGTHTITLTATDSAGATALDTIQIIVGPQLAMADAGPSRFVAVGTQVPLDASQSTGVGPLVAAWQIAVKPAGSAASLANSNAFQTTFVADVAGIYELVLTIRDGVGGGASTRLTVTAVAASGLADLAITGGAAPNPAIAGGLFTYTFVVRNNGAATATGVTVTDTLPGGLHLVSAPGCSVSGNTVMCSLPFLASGSNASINVTVSLDCGVTNQTTIVNSASATTTAPETNLVDNVASVSVTATNSGPAQACLYVNVNGGGAVLRNPNQSSFNLNSSVVLTAIPDAGWAFADWSGDASGSANPLTLLLDGSKTVTANFVAIPGSCLPPPEGLVDWWPASGNASDVIGNNNGALQNGATYAGGKVGQAFSFGGTNDMMLIGAAPIQPPWTAELWVNRQDSPAYSSVLLVDGATALKLEQYPFTRKVGFTQFGVADYTFNYSTPTNTWVHLAYVADATGTHLYANGVLQGTISATIALPLGQLGSDNAGDRLKGLVDELSVYDRALSAAEIQAIYNAGSAGKCVPNPYPPGSCVPAPYGLVNWWPGAGTATDFVGVNNGVLQNGATFAPGQVGTAFSFDGVNDYVQIPGYLNTVPVNEVTVEFWQKVSSTKVQSTFSTSSFVNGSAFNAHIPYSDGNVYWDFGNISTGGRLTWTPPASLVGSWWHFALVASQSGNYMAIYTNGVLATSKSGMTPFIRANMDLDIGGAASLGISFGGLIDEFSIYDRVLSPDEIYAAYAAGSAGKCLPPVYITEISRSGNNVSISWLAQQGAVYRLQYKTNLTDAIWTDVSGDVTATGSAASKTDATPANTSPRFYRVEMFR